MSINWASEEYGARLVDYSSSLRGCEANNVLVDNISKIWLTEPYMPQWFCVSFESISARNDIVFQSFGWHVWHKYTTNPKDVQLHVSKDGTKFKLWDSFTANQWNGTKLFSCSPINVEIYPFLAIEVISTFGGEQTYMNRLYIFSDDVASTPRESFDEIDIRKDRHSWNAYNESLSFIGELTTQKSTFKLADKKDLMNANSNLVCQGDTIKDLSAKELTTISCSIDSDSLSNSQHETQHLIKHNKSNESVNKNTHVASTILPNYFSESVWTQTEVSHLNETYTITRQRNSLSRTQTSSDENSVINTTISCHIQDNPTDNNDSLSQALRLSIDSKNKTDFKSSQSKYQDNNKILKVLSTNSTPSCQINENFERLSGSVGTSTFNSSSIEKCIENRNQDITKLESNLIDIKNLNRSISNEMRQIKANENTKNNQASPDWNSNKQKFREDTPDMSSRNNIELQKPICSKCDITSNPSESNVMDKLVEAVYIIDKVVDKLNNKVDALGVYVNSRGTMGSSNYQVTPLIDKTKSTDVSPLSSEDFFSDHNSNEYLETEHSSHENKKPLFSGRQLSTDLNEQILPREKSQILFDKRFPSEYTSQHDDTQSKKNFVSDDKYKLQNNQSISQQEIFSKQMEQLIVYFEDNNRAIDRSLVSDEMILLTEHLQKSYFKKERLVHALNRQELIEKGLRQKISKLKTIARELRR